jgi:hypothetical protein
MIKYQLLWLFGVSEQVNVAVTLHACIRKVHGSNLGSLILTEEFRRFTHSNQANAGMLPSNKPRPPPSMPLPTDCS